VFDLHQAIVIHQHVVIVNVLPTLGFFSFAYVDSAGTSFPLPVLPIFTDVIVSKVATFLTFNFFLLALKLEIVIVSFLIQSLFQ
jgi:hypothetical protein